MVCVEASARKWRARERQEWVGRERRWLDQVGREGEDEEEVMVVGVGVGAWEGSGVVVVVVLVLVSVLVLVLVVVVCARVMIAVLRWGSLWRRPPPPPPWCQWLNFCLLISNNINRVLRSTHYWLLIYLVKFPHTTYYRHLLPTTTDSLFQLPLPRAQTNRSDAS